MKLRQLTIERLPGINHPLSIELPDDRVALVIGPNASGKSSLIRALKTLLERKPSKDEQAAQTIVQAVFEHNGQRIEGSALANARSWRIDGQQADRPDWPDTDQLDAYLIHADDLIDPGQTEQTISTELKQVLSGGVDLDGLVNQAPFKSPPRPAGLKRKIEQTDQAIRALEANYARITSDVDSLETLRTEHQQAAEAERRLSLLERALEWLGVRQKIELTQKKLAQLPEGLDRLNGHEAESLQAIEQEQTRKQQQLERLQRDFKQAQSDLNQLQIDDIEQTQIWRDDLATLHKHLQDASTRLRELNERRAAAEAKLERAAHRSSGLNRDAIGRLSPERLQQMETAIDALLNCQNQLEDLQQRIERYRRHELDREHADQVEQAITYLRRWLALPPAPMSAWVIWSLLLIAAGSAAGWFWQQQQMWYALLSGTVALLPLSHLIQLGVRSYRSTAVKNQMQSLPLDAPAQWQIQPVEQQLRSLESEHAKAQRVKANLEQADELSIELQNAELALIDHQQHLDKLAEPLALKTHDLIQAGRSLRLQNLYDWQQADSALHELKNSIQIVEGAIEKLTNSAKQCLHKINPDQTESIEPEQLDSRIKQLDRRLTDARELRQSMRSLQQSAEQTQSDIEALAAQRQQLFENAGHLTQNPTALLQQLEHLDDYRKTLNTLRGLEITAKAHELALQSDRKLTDLTLHQDEAALLQLQLELQNQAEQREAIKQRIADIEHEHQQALQGRELEGLIAERETLRQQLLDALDQQRMASAGQFLLARIQQEQHQQHQPALLKRATHWFARFTHSRYELKFDGQTFSAMDHQHGQRRGLAELSTATRVQLKLALRLAWIDQLDQRRPSLPIFLDEVLATADPERYQAVVQAAQELIRAGRQVVYLSAQPMDAKAWQRFGGEPEPAIIRIDESKDTVSIDFAVAETVPLPDAKLDPTEWADQAGVQAFDPWQPIAAMDAFHLLRDQLDQLNELRRRDIRSLGQLEHAIQLDLIEDQDQFELRIKAASAWIQRWRLGQTPPIDVSTLAKSGRVSETYIEGVANICRHVNGDARALINILADARSPLKVPGFGGKKTELLEEWLGENGFLDQPQPAQDFELINAMTESGSVKLDQVAEWHLWMKAAIKPYASNDR